MVDRTDKCALCLGDGPLKNSHVIPERWFRSLYGEKGRAIVFNTGSKRSHPYRQKGPYEPLLCGDCEQLLNREYETPFDRAWGKGRPNLTTPRPEFVQIRLPASARLFFASVLWRASVARSDWWKAVSLGPHEEAFRRAVLELRPDRIPDFQVVGSLLVDRRTQAPNFDVVVSPGRCRVGGARGYRLTFAAGHWLLLPKGTDALHLLELTPSGSMVLPILDAQEPLRTPNILRAAREHPRARKRRHDAPA